MIQYRDPTKVAIITDTLYSYGARKGSKFLHDYFEKFYDDVFFPTLEAEELILSFTWVMPLIVANRLIIKV